MSDPLRTDPSRALDDASEADRDAKIEHLLLAGLDEYFAAQYEQAINVWTRALFIDRSHPRARAYIERARCALAERQRESEELLHKGVAAFDRGESHRARQLLREAIEKGAPPEEALAVLERLNRLDSPAPADPPRSVRAAPSVWTPRRPRAMARPKIRLLLPLLTLLAFIAMSVAVVALWNHVDWGWLVTQQTATPASTAPPSPSEVVFPVPRRGETALARARALAASGHLHDSLAALDAVRTTDAQKPEADRLRADIQRQLIGLTKGLVPVASSSDTPGGRVP